MTTKEGNTHLRKSVGLSENIKRTWQQNKFLENARLMGDLAKSKKKQTKKARKSTSGLQPEFSDIERKILEKITAKQKRQSPKTLKKSSSPRWGMKEKQAAFQRYLKERLTNRKYAEEVRNRMAAIKHSDDEDDDPASPVDINFTTYDDKIEFTRGRVGNKSKKRKKKKRNKSKKSKRKRSKRRKHKRGKK